MCKDFGRRQREARAAAARRAADERQAAAAAMSRSVFDRTPTGARVPVQSPIAVEALHHTFLTMLERGAESHAIQIDADTAAAFPRKLTPPAGFATFLAVATNSEGRAVFTIHSVSRAEGRLLALPDADADHGLAV